MTDFLVLFREPDGRTDRHEAEFTQQHQRHWQVWLAQHGQRDTLLGGQSLTLNGQVLRTADGPALPCPHRVGSEIVGGYLLLKTANLEEAVTLLRSCPIFEAGGYVEIREIAATAL